MAPPGSGEDRRTLLHPAPAVPTAGSERHAFVSCQSPPERLFKGRGLVAPQKSNARRAIEKGARLTCAAKCAQNRHGLHLSGCSSSLSAQMGPLCITAEASRKHRKHPRRWPLRDRKSTRLNSSHVEISY